jgi:energy-coupling factor transport system substrate-specific component
VNRQASWRTVDIVVTAAIAVAFGVIFWAWNQLWVAVTPVFAAVPPAQYLISGVWLIPAILCALVIRKPGAALFGELVAASVSTILGSQWGLDTLLSGAIQGALAEIVFGATLYANWNLGTAIIASIGAAIGEWLHDMPIYYKDLALPDQLTIGVFMLISALVIAGFGSWWLTRALVQTGVLAQFPSGRSQQRV